ncbi:MAG: hypothetical protein AAF384_15510 [Pseudomonadota bacterium]
MALGNEIGTFDMKSTSVTLEGSGGRVTNAEVNFEGDLSGEFKGFALATMSVNSKDGKDGTYKVTARCFMADGSIVDAVGEGTTTSAGGQKWTVAGIADTSDGRSTAVRGEIDLINRRYSGKMFERT